MSRCMSLAELSSLNQPTTRASSSRSVESAATLQPGKQPLNFVISERNARVRTSTSGWAVFEHSRRKGQLSSSNGSRGVQSGLQSGSAPSLPMSSDRAVAVGAGGMDGGAAGRSGAVQRLEEGHAHTSSSTRERERAHRPSAGVFHFKSNTRMDHSSAEVY